ncbi:HEAT repeat domain-containing protein [Actinomadura fibrosa]|uniref:HEAT repeat domain-containing protein n=1 Tax=Actinomadura fibrosa TaxID=111802 RepID=A0ABW2XJN9_9ACTN|nr:HEAT repeat domain-containing protein [Actinomadura fibrosa]
MSGSEPIGIRLERVAAKLAALRRADGESGPRAVPALGPPLAAERVAAFERRNGVRLPGAYRAFLTMIGNGGPGPYQGLDALDPDLADRQLAGEFPYDPDDLPGTWTQEMSALGFWKPYRGTLPLARHHRMEWAYHETAEPVSMLVLSGPGRGRVVMVDRCEEYFPPVYHPARDFLAWYEEWLDARAAGEWGLRRTDFDRPGWTPVTVRDHPDPEEAVWAARMYAARVGRWDWPEAPPQACETLAEAASANASPRVRAAAAWALHHVRREVGALALPLLRDPDPRVRRQAITGVAASEALHRTVVRDAFRPLLRDPDPWIRAAMVRALGPEEDVAGVLRALLADPDPDARRAGLGRIATLDYWAPDRKTELVDAARPLLRDADPGVRATAVAVLDSAGVPWGRAMLVAAAFSDPDAGVRRSAVERLLRYGGRTALVPSVPVLLGDPDDQIRHATLHRLGYGSYQSNRIPARYWTFAARPLLADPCPEVRAKALQTLVRAKEPPPEDAWPPLLADPYPPLRRTALRLASEIRAEPGGPVHAALHRSLHGPSRDLRWAAVSGLGDTCTAACREEIGAALDAEDDRVVRYCLTRITERLDTT